LLFVPPKRKAPRLRVGVALTNGVALLEGGELKDIGDCDGGDVLFALSHEAALSLLYRFGGEAYWWKRRYSKYKVKGRPIFTMRELLSEHEPPEALAELVAVRDWLETHGGKIGSLPGAALSVWRRTLPRPLLVARKRFPLPEREFILGARQECEAPGLYDEAEFWDMRGAYQWALSTVMVAAAYHHRTDYMEPADLADRVGFARADVYLPKGLPYGPLPSMQRRGASYPKTGCVSGVFDIKEIELAWIVGARVYIKEAWIGNAISLPFESWSEIVSEGRQMPGAAGAIVKTMGNSLWGYFASSGRGSTIFYTDGRREKIVPDERSKPPLCKTIAAHVTALIRRRLFEEALRRDTISAHTDGAFFPRGHKPAGIVGANVGEWRLDKSAKNLVVLSAQMYSFDDEKGCRHYSMSGAPPEAARSAFQTVYSAMERRGELAPDRLPGDFSNIWTGAVPSV
jgi:hypothetical protein